MTVEDPNLRIALFLHTHPGWTLRDLDTADPDVIEQMRALEQMETQVAASRAQAQNMTR